MSRQRVNLADMLDGEPLDEPTQAAPPPPGATVAITQIAPNPGNPRGAIDADDAEFLGLVLSLEDVGVITPLTLCSAGAFLKHHPQHSQQVADHLYVVVAGHRRLEAARRAGLSEVPAHVNDAAAEDPLVWAVAENLQRVGLNPIQEAEALRVLTDKPPAGSGMSQTKVAKGIGKTQAFVSQRIALLDLVPELQAKVVSGELGVKAARTYTSLPADRQLAAYETVGEEPSGHNPVIGAVPVHGSQPLAAVQDEGSARSGAGGPSEVPSKSALSHNRVIEDRSDQSNGIASEQQAAVQVAVDSPPAVPEQRNPGQETDALSVDWHDIPAFVAAIRQVLNNTEVYQLAETLIDSLRD